MKILWCGAVLSAAVTCTAGERKELDGRVYYLYPATRVQTGAGLFVWLHPGNGDARPQFEWWKRSRLFGPRMVLLCPQAQAASWQRGNDETFLTKVIEHVMKQYRVDARRVYLGGHSSGGCFTWQYGLRHQEKFCTLLPACAAWHDSLAVPRKEKGPAVHIYHSTNDPVFPFTHASRAKAVLEEKGFTVTLLEDDRGHAIGPKFPGAVRRILARKPSR